MNFLNLTLGIFDGLLGGSGASADGTAAKGFPIIFLVLMMAAMYFLTVRPQKKKQKEEQALRENLQIGDEITTIGGIVGKIVTIKEDSVIIETGADRVRMRVMRWAVQTNNTANAKLQAEREAAKRAREEAKGKKPEKEKSFAEAEAEKEKNKEQ